jgi:hypothetical protein
MKKGALIIATVFLGAGIFGGTARSATLSIQQQTLPAATQYKSYSAPALSAVGGTAPYTWSVVNSSSYATLPEGMSLGSSTGVISSTQVGGQGMYTFQVRVTDAAGQTASNAFTIDVTADDTLNGLYFPSNSIFVGQRIDGLPVDTSPAAQIPSKYLNTPIWPYFGDGYSNMPAGIPFIKVPYNQPLVNVTISGCPGNSDSCWSDPFPAGSGKYTYPIPPNAPIEASANSGGDMHVLVYQEAGGGQPARLFEMYKAQKNSDGSWSSEECCWWELDSNALRPADWTSSDAAGLPIAPLLVNYDEAMSAGGIQHPVRFTQDLALGYYVWPARHASLGAGSCTLNGKGLPSCTEISESTPPTSCTWGTPFGEIYRLKSAVDVSQYCPQATHPQGYAILTAIKKYGMIVTDNGGTGLVGTADARWNNDDLSCIESVNFSNFEPVNTSSLMVNPDSAQVTNSAATPPPTSPPTYTITASAAAGGSISPSGSVTVNANANQTFTITPNAGYQISAVMVDGSSVGAVSSYTFTNDTASHSIAATFAPGALWQNASSLGNGWESLSWFGYFNTDNSPWIYHSTLGWLYPYGTSTDSIWFYDPAMGGFWWTSRTAYPFIYSLKDGAWLYYTVGSSNPRRFYNCTTKSMESN